LVKPNGLVGDAYMALIKPFRYLFVYPPMLRELTRTWDESIAQSAASSSSMRSNTVPSSPG
jgi:hypothetical protein